MKIKILCLLIFLSIPNLVFAQKDQNISTEYPFAVCYYEKEDVYFVSYIAGEPVKLNANGYISKFDNKLENAVLEYFIIGLNAPRGMVILEDKLYIADVNEIKVFDLNKNEKLDTIILGPMGQSFVSDICTDGKFLYVCDMFDNRIIQIDVSKDNELITLVEGAKLDFPSAILYDKDKLIYTTFFDGAIISLDLNDLFAKTLIITGVKNINGIVMDNKKNIYFSGGIKQGGIYKFSSKERFEKLDQANGMLGDVCLKDNKEIIAPVLFRKGDFKRIKV
ncbi:hypothetical protein KKC59_02920 [bacterium]|nr:hypothetical protein [bacterium]